MHEWPLSNEIISFFSSFFEDDNSRVALQGDMDVIGSDYINANYINVRDSLAFHGVMGRGGNSSCQCVIFNISGFNLLKMCLKLYC